MPRGSQLARQWQLLHLIDRPAGVAVEDAARVLDCAVRTIWRDLDVLQRAGFPIYDERAADGRRSVWRIREEFRLGLPLKLSLSEVAALLMSHDLLKATGAGALGPSIASAFQKVGRVLSRDAVALLGRMRDTIGVRAFGAKLQAPAAEHVALIQRALLDRRRLEIEYYSMSRDEVTTRLVDPYHLTLFGGGFYLVARCHLRGSVRIFAVERIRAARVLATRFDVPRGFDVEAYLKEAWGIVRGDIVTVKALFSARAARHVRDRLWHPSQKLRDLPGGRLEVTLRVADTLEVRRWLLGFGPEAEVLEPAALREALRQEAEALARKLAPGRKPPAAAAESLPGASEPRLAPGAAPRRPPPGPARLRPA